MPERDTRLVAESIVNTAVNAAVRVLLLDIAEVLEAARHSGQRIGADCKRHGIGTEQAGEQARAAPTGRAVTARMSG